MAEDTPLLRTKERARLHIGALSMPLRPSAHQRKFVTGVVLLLCVVVLWTFSSFITSDLLDGGFDKPFLITYLNTASFAFYLLPFAWKRWRRGRQADDRPDAARDGYVRPTHRASLSYDETRPRTLSTSGPDSTAAPKQHMLQNRRSTSLIRSLSPSPALVVHHQPLVVPGSPLAVLSELPRRSSEVLRPSSEEVARADEPFLPPEEVESENPALDPLTTRETAHLAAVFCFAWIAANWSLNASLGLTSVGSSTILAGMSGFFTLGLGRLVGVETLTRSKILAVLASFLGLLLVTHSDSLIATSAVPNAFADNSTLPHTPPADPVPHSSGPRNPLAGDLLALLSAFCYALYVILLKVRIGDEERVNMQLFFGFVGMFNTILLAPLLPLLHYTGIEPFALPSTRAQWIVCGVNMVITLASDYLYVLAMLKTTPVVVTVGLSLSIPLALLGDALRGSTASLTIQAALGAALVLIGFGLMGGEGMEENQPPAPAAVRGLGLAVDGEGDEADRIESTQERDRREGRRRAIVLPAPPAV